MPGNGKKIFLAEDDPLIAGVYSEALKASGFVVELAFDGEQAIAVLDKMYEAKDLPAVILLDVMMPKKTGLDVLAHIKKHNLMKYTPVIMLTNLSETADVDRALEGGAVMYLIKVQNTPREVVAKVVEMVESYHGNAKEAATAASVRSTAPKRHQ